MNAIEFSPHVLRLGCTLALLAGAAVALAQTPNRSVRIVPQPTAPSGIAPGVAGPGTPNPAGLPSPVPSPAGLPSQFPAGLPSPLPNPAGLPSPTVPNLASPGSPAGSPPVDTAVIPPSTVLGAPGYGGAAAAGAAVPAAGSGPYTALQIAQSFIGADTNRDGELTRAEAQRLTIMPYAFEEMDRNRDGVLTRFEYDDGVR